MFNDINVIFRRDLLELLNGPRSPRAAEQTRCLPRQPNLFELVKANLPGMVPTILHLQRLASYGVGFHSYTEPHVATDNELVRNILLALLASLAKVEAQKISERTRV